MVDEDDYDELRSRPDVLPRGALEHTCTFVTEEDPGLAKRIARVLSAAPLSPPDMARHNHHRDHFVVDLSAAEVRDIMRALSARRRTIERSVRAPGDGNFVLLQALLEEWADLAAHLEAEARPTPHRTPPPLATPDYDLN